LRIDCALARLAALLPQLQLLEAFLKRRDLFIKFRHPDSLPLQLN
jgi:hypothetical protein